MPPVSLIGQHVGAVMLAEGGDGVVWGLFPPSAAFGFLPFALYASFLCFAGPELDFLEKDGQPGGEVDRLGVPEGGLADGNAAVDRDSELS